MAEYSRLELKHKKFEVYISSSSSNSSFGKALPMIVTRGDTKHVSDKEGLKTFYDHCCIIQHYLFSIKAYGEEECKISSLYVCL